MIHNIEIDNDLERNWIREQFELFPVGSLWIEAHYYKSSDFPNSVLVLEHTKNELRVLFGDGETTFLNVDELGILKAHYRRV